MAEYILGVDPGWANCGVAVLKVEDGKFTLEESKVIVPKKLGYKNSVETIVSMRQPYVSVGMERFVSYRGITTSSSEDILMFIGALRLGITPDAILFRAVDWKNYVLHKLGLKVETGKLDKVFSFAVAEAICGVKPKTDHEADAIGIAFSAYNLHRSKR